MKKLFFGLLMFLCFAITAHAQGITLNRTVSQEQALQFVKDNYPQEDADYYQYSPSGMLSSNWVIFVDPYPTAGWEHDCYTYSVPKTVIGFLNKTHVKESHYTLPPKGEYTRLDVKTRFSTDASTRIYVPSNSNENTGTAQASHTYAVIISGGFNRDSNFHRYWNDCSYIYKVLCNRYRIDKDRIYPIYADGSTSNNLNLANDIYKPQYGKQNLDFDGDGIAENTQAATKENIANTLSYLSNKMNKNNQLVLYVTDHGGNDSYGSYIWLWQYDETTDAKLYDYELASMLQPFIDKKINVNVVMGQCFSGGFVDDLTKAGCVVATACAENEVSYAAPNGFDEFVYYWTTALNGYDHEGNPIESDINGDGVITMDEAFEYAYSTDHYVDGNVKYSFAPFCTYKENPQYNSCPLSIGEDMSINMVPDPVNLYIRDNHNDTGKQPNLTTDIIWDSPDIWISSNSDDVDHESIDLTTGQTTATIHVTIRNRGINDYISGERLYLYWAENTCGSTVATWLGQESYNGAKIGGVIGSIPVPHIPAGASITIPTEWEIPTAILNSGKKKLNVNILARITNSLGVGNSPFTSTYPNFIRPSLDRALAQKSVVIQMAADGFPKIKTLIRNDKTQTQSFTIKLKSRLPIQGSTLTRPVAIVTVSDRLLQKWIQGGRISNGFVQSTTNPNQFSANTFPAELSNISLQPSEIEELDVMVTYAYQSSSLSNPRYIFDLMQLNNKGEIVGGNTLSINPYSQAAVIPGINSVNVNNGEYALSINGETSDYSTIWINSDGELIGCDNSVIVKPTKDKTDYTAITINSEGAVAVSEISLAPEIGIQSVSPTVSVTDYIDVRLKGNSQSNSRFEISTLTGNSDNLIIALEQGIENHRIDVSSLSAGWYVISLISGDQVIDKVKFQKK